MTQPELRQRPSTKSVAVVFFQLLFCLPYRAPLWSRVARSVPLDRARLRARNSSLRMQIEAMVLASDNSTKQSDYGNGIHRCPIRNRAADQTRGECSHLYMALSSGTSRACSALLRRSWNSFPLIGRSKAAEPARDFWFVLKTRLKTTPHSSFRISAGCFSKVQRPDCEYDILAPPRRFAWRATSNSFRPRRGIPLPPRC